MTIINSSSYKSLVKNTSAMVTESKLDDSFPVSKINVEGFGAPFRLDRNKNSGALFYIFAATL